jgi:protein-L-isoaspartate(D-aspartate) O-methyltransferase
MIEEQIIARGIKNKAVLDAMRKVKRQYFVPEHLQAAAYDDNPLPIGHEQTISQPFIVASMTELIQPQKNQVVLEVGTGSGYQAAVLAEIVKLVYTIEIIPELGKEAQKRFQNLGIQNIRVKIGDGYQGWKEHAPFDAILVTAATDEIPQPLLDQLKPGGRLVIPVGPHQQIQNLMLIQKDDQGKIVEKTQYPVRFVPLTRAKTPQNR